jgi:cell filamentation protein
VSRPLDEGGLTAWRIAELVEHPLPGSFDAPHLLAHHAWIFQDLPRHRPGQWRPDALAHIKARELESGGRYYVPYAPYAFLQQDLPRALDGLDPAAWAPLSGAEFANRLATLYARLDYLHPFQEGNSRTLRTFTRAMAQAAGFRLDWGTTNVDAAHRDALYRARDRAVLEQAYPGLDEARAMVTDDPLEYESWAVLPFLRRGRSLTDLITASMERIERQPGFPPPAMMPSSPKPARRGPTLTP